MMARTVGALLPRAGAGQRRVGLSRARGAPPMAACRAAGSAVHARGRHSAWGAAEAFWACMLPP
jgi:hypothetical protein